MTALAVSLAPPQSVAVAFEDVYATEFTYVWRVLRSLGVPEALLDDAAQDVFIVVHRRLPEFAGRSTLRTWLFGIARGIAANARRAHRRRGPQVPLDDAPPMVEARDPAAAASANQQAQILLAMLDQLDDDKREVFVLMDMEGATAPEAAALLGVNSNTIYTRLRAARASMTAAAKTWRERHGG